MSKFCYEKGDIIIKDSICAGCIYDKQEESCENYEHIPNEIIKNEKACKFYCHRGKIKL